MLDKESCRGCGKAISLAYREWWDESDDNACVKLGTHAPFIRIELPPTPVVSTSGPVTKWRKTGTGRIVSGSAKRLSEKYQF